MARLIRRHRGPGKGHVYRRGRTWWISLYVDGRRHRESSHSTKRSDALALLGERVALLAPQPGTAGTRLSDLAGMVLTSYELNARRSTRRLRASLAHLRDHFGDPLARSIDEASLFGYAEARLKAGAGAGTINVELAALRRAFRLALELRRVARVPRFRMLAPPAPRQGFVERPQLEAILAQLPASVRPVVQAAAITGWRLKSELLTRRWQHVDLGAGWLRLEAGEGKTGQGRMFPLTAELRELLEAQRARAGELERHLGRSVEAVFFQDDGEPIRSIRRSWSAATKAAGCRGLRPHDLRRTAVRNLERAGVPRSSAMKLVGHRTQAMYDRYSIVDEVMLREAASKIDVSKARTGHSDPSPGHPDDPARARMNSGGAPASGPQQPSPGADHNGDTEPRS